MEREVTSEGKRRGRPFRNGRVHELYAAEFKRLASTDNPCGKDRKLIKRLAQTMLYQGFSVTEISSALSIPKSTVCLWRDKLDGATKAEIEQTVLKSVSGKMAEFLHASLEAVAKIAHSCSDEAYIAKHSPAEMARLLEVLGDQAFRLIEAKQRADLARRQVEIENGQSVVPSSNTTRDLVPAVK
jgi:hypothetical protein